MKKIAIFIIIIALGIIAGFTGYSVAKNSINKANNTIKFDNKNSLINSSNTKKINSDNTNNSNKTQDETNNIHNENQISNNDDNNQVQSQSNISGSTTVNQNNTNSVSDKSSNIQWVLGNNQSSIPNTIIIRNNTGKNISNQQLVEYIKKWILIAQSNYSQGCAATMWVPEFFDVVPNSDLIQAFINSNGQAALGENITASELERTNGELEKIISKNQPLLSQTQILEYIYQNILSKNRISKIENERYSYLIYSNINGKEVLYNGVDKYTGTTSC
ncbi:MAG: hypothetical protein ACRC57_14555 [Sarcina sp.]